MRRITCSSSCWIVRGLIRFPRFPEVICVEVGRALSAEDPCVVLVRTVSRTFGTGSHYRFDSGVSLEFSPVRPYGSSTCLPGCRPFQLRHSSARVLPPAVGCSPATPQWFFPCLHDGERLQPTNFGDGNWRSRTALTRSPPSFNAGFGPAAVTIPWPKPISRVSSRL